MPTKCANGTCKWGNHGHAYHYTVGNQASLERARAKANRQGAAARAHGYGKRK